MAQPQSLLPASDTSVVTASAALVNMADEDPMKLSSRAKRIGTALGWQQESWTWYGKLGEVWYSHTWRGRAIGGLQWLIGYRDETGQIQPARDARGVPIEGLDLGMLTLAEEALAELVGPNGSQREWAEPLGTSISCVAEGWLVGYHVDVEGDPVHGDGAVDEDGEFIEPVGVVWEAFSPTEISLKNGDTDEKVVAVQRTAEGEATKLPTDTLAIRIFNRHPRWPDDPDGAMQPLLDVCEDLYALRLSVRASALSRTHSGLLLIPTEGLGQPLAQHANKVSGGGQEGQGEPVHPVVKQIIAGLTTPHRDPGSAATLVPTAITTKSDHIEKWKHLPLTRDIDPAQAEQRVELIRAFATGVDLPPERLLGMADLNHWTAWQIGEDSWRHVDPTAATLAIGATSAYLWTSMLAKLEDAGTEITEPIRQRVRVFCLTYDPTPVIISPDHSDDADAAHAAGTISDAAYRRMKHISEDDAPTIEELERRARLGFGAKTVAMGTVVGPAQSDQPSAAGPADAARVVVTASAGGSSIDQGSPEALAEFAAACADLEATFLRESLLVVDVAVDEAIRKAQARIRSAAQRDPSLRSLVRGVPNDRLVSVIGPRELRAMAARFAEDAADDDVSADEGLFAGALALMGTRFRGLVDDAHGEFRRLASKWLGVEFDDADKAEMATDAAASVQVLETGARRAAQASLTGNVADLDVAAEGGEVPSAVRVPPVVVRRAAARAGGTAVGGGIDPMEAGYEGGVSSGPTAGSIMGRNGYRTTGLLWVYGSESTRRASYQPHVDLDGVEAVDLEGFVGFYPGDHGGCQCGLARLYEPVREPAAGEGALTG